MKILFFDTETTGLPKNWKAPVEQIDNWPRLVQIAWQVYNHEGDLLEEHEYVIKPVGFIIPSAASDVHKISTEKALEIGVDLLTILKVFSSSVKDCGLLVAHNYSFDYNIMGSELIRNGLENTLREKEYICTMKASTDFCKIPSPNGYKWPKLEELYYKLFQESFNAHDALDDIKATAKCFWKLNETGEAGISQKLLNDSVQLINIGFFPNPLHEDIKIKIHKDLVALKFTTIPFNFASYIIVLIHNEISKVDNESELETLSRLVKQKKVVNNNESISNVRDNFLFKLDQHFIDSYESSPLFKLKDNFKEKYKTLLSANIISIGDTLPNRELCSSLSQYFGVSYYQYLVSLKSNNPLVQAETNYYKLKLNKHDNYFDEFQIFFKQSLTCQITQGEKMQYYILLLNYLKKDVDAFVNAKSEAISNIKKMPSDFVNSFKEQFRAQANIYIEINSRLSSVKDLSDVYYGDCSVIKTKMDDFINSTKKEGCYIATMVYGNYDHSRVLLLRSYRDNTLKKSIIGRLFVRFYYFTSPKLVKILKGKRLINTLIKNILNFITSLL